MKKGLEVIFKNFGAVKLGEEKMSEVTKEEFIELTKNSEGNEFFVKLIDLLEKSPIDTVTKFDMNTMNIDLLLITIVTMDDQIWTFNTDYDHPSTAMMVVEINNQEYSFTSYGALTKSN